MTFIIVLLVLIAAFFGLLWYIAGEVSRRKPERDNLDPELCKGTVWESKAALIRDVVEKNKDIPYEEVTIESYDGLKLYAKLIKGEGETKATILMMHGYRSCAENDFSLSLNFYRSLGIDLLVPDQRSSGKSEGNYITFGVRERYDAVSWTEFLCKRYGENFPILVTGISMGASSVLMAAGLGYPENVRAVIADCGFSNPYDIVKSVCEKRRLPVTLIMPLATVAVKLFAGFGLRDASVLEAMKTNKTPIFFAHGEEDDYVPCEMTRWAYNACQTEKKLFTVPGAGHGDCFIMEREKYQKELCDFILPKIAQ